MSAAIETPAPAAPTPAPSAPPAATPAPTPAPSAPAKTGLDALPKREDNWDPKAFAERHRQRASGKQPEKKETPPSGKVEARAPEPQAPAPTPEQPQANGATEPAAGTPPAPEGAARTFKVKFRGQERDVAIDKAANILRLPASAIENLVKEHGEEWVTYNVQRQLNHDELARENATEKKERAALERKVRSVFGKANATPAEMARLIFEQAGVGTDVKEVALQIAMEELELDQLPEDSRKLRKLEQQLELERAERQAAMEENERILSQVRAQEQAAADQKFVAEYGQEMVAALVDAKLPAQGWAMDRMLTLLAREQQELGQRYRPPVGRAEMRQRAARFVKEIEAERDAVVKSSVEALGPDGWRERYKDEATVIGERAAEERVDEFRKNQRRQIQGIRDRADETERRPPPPRQSEDLMAWVDRVYKD